MQGRCRDYRMQLGPEFALWRQPPFPREAARDRAAASAQPISLRQRYRVALLPAQSVPEAANADAYAGLLSFRVPGSGYYRVSLGAPAEVGLYLEDQEVPVHEFEMQSRCESVTKSVEYILRAGKTYLLVVTAETEQVDVLVTARR